LVELAQVRDVKENRYKAKDVVAIKRGFDVPGAQFLERRVFRIVPFWGDVLWVDTMGLPSGNLT
jgi:hypothetical protein